MIGDTRIRTSERIIMNLIILAILSSVIVIKVVKSKIYTDLGHLIK